MMINYSKNNKNSFKFVKDNGWFIAIGIALIICFFGLCHCVDKHNKEIEAKFELAIKEEWCHKYLDGKWSDGHSGWYRLQEYPLETKRQIVKHYDAIQYKLKCIK